MTCEYCGHPITSEDWDNDQVHVINSERTKSPVVDTKAVHKDCIEEAPGENFNPIKSN